MDGEFDGRAGTRGSKAKYNSENCFHELPPSVLISFVPFSRVRRVYANVDGEFDGRAVTRRSKAKYNAKYNSENCFHELPPSGLISFVTEDGLASGEIAVSVTSPQIGLLETIAALKPGQTILLHACPSEVDTSIEALGLGGHSNWPTGSLWMLKVMNSLRFARASRLIFFQVSHLLFV